MVYTDNHLITLNSAYGQKLNGSMKSQLLFGFTGLLQDQEDIENTFITITNAQIPVSFYTITSTNNNVSYVKSSITYNITIPVGNYNSSSLISALTSSFISSGTTVIITISSINGKLSFASISTFTLKASSTMGLILGFTTDILCTGSSSTTLTYPLNLLGVKKVSIKSDALAISAYSSINFSTSNTLTTIPIDQPPFNMVSYVNQSDMNTNILQSRTLNTIDISIVDENNNLLDFNNCDWSISICLSIHRTNNISNNVDLIKFFSILKESKTELNQKSEKNSLDQELEFLIN